jgi:hypothetical protein
MEKYSYFSVRKIQKKIANYEENIKSSVWRMNNKALVTRDLGKRTYVGIVYVSIILSVV